MTSVYPPPDEEPIPQLESPELSTPVVLDENSPEFKLQEKRATIVMEVVVPQMLEAGRALMTGARDAPERVASLLVMLANTAREENEDENGFWTSARSICYAIFVDGESAIDIAKRTEELDKREGFAWKTQCVMAYLAASMHPHVIPRLAITLHMAVAEFIHRHTSYNPEVYEVRLMPWFVWFWYRTFENAKFRFYAPPFVAMDLDDAMKSPPGVRLQRVLRAIAFGLWEPLPEKSKQWFVDASPDYSENALNAILPDNLSGKTK